MGSVQDYSLTAGSVPSIENCLASGADIIRTLELGRAEKLQGVRVNFIVYDISIEEISRSRLLQ